MRYPFPRYQRWRQYSARHSWPAEYSHRGKLLSAARPTRHDWAAGTPGRVSIVKAAIRAPMQQIIKNSGLDNTEIENRLEDFRELQKYNYGFDVKEEEYGNMYTIGIIDPLKVTKNALLNSSSVASTILSTNAIVTHARIKS